MAPTELEYAEQRMQQRWYDLVMAEQRGAGTAVLERLYRAYLLAVDSIGPHILDQVAGLYPEQFPGEKETVEGLEKDISDTLVDIKMS